MGFICYERSPRHVVTLPSYLPVRCRRVGVFVNAPIPSIYNKVKELGLDIIQLHGDEPPGPGYGGTGHRFDWDILRGYNGPTPFLLSGGLGPDSLKDLATFAHPLWAGIDLNSGFEVSPGMKDPVRLRDFIKQFRTLQL